MASSTALAASFTIKELTDKHYNGYEFNTKNCTVILIRSGKTKMVVLDNFVCGNGAKKGEGRALLLKALKYISDKDKDINTITLESVPHTEKYRKSGITKAVAQQKLNTYYGSLGFINKESNEFEGKLSDLIRKIETRKGGRKTRKAKINKRKVKKTRRQGGNIKQRHGAT